MHEMNRKTKILIIDDNDINSDILCDFITGLGYDAVTASNGQEGYEALEKEQPDAILLDIVMPVMDGYGFLDKVNQTKIFRKIPIIVISGLNETESIIKCIKKGAVDYLEKPFNLLILESRLKSCLLRKRLNDNQEEHRKYLKMFNDELCKKVQEQVGKITSAQVGTIFALAKLAEYRDKETGLHLYRIAEYCKAVARHMRKAYPKYHDIIDDDFIINFEISAPLHDIGKVGVPDKVLLKPGKLTPEEYEIVKTHTLIGAEALREIHAKHPENNFIANAIDVAHYHHEKWDGSGYPTGLKGENIPLPARILSLGDVYDALTTTRCYKEKFSEEKSREIIVNSSGTHFDPIVVESFLAIEEEFVKIREQFSEERE